MPASTLKSNGRFDKRTQGGRRGWGVGGKVGVEGDVYVTAAAAAAATVMVVVVVVEWGRKRTIQGERSITIA